MRFKDMLTRGIGKDRKPLKPKPYRDDTVAVGHRVRCEWDRHGDVIGTVAADLGEHWIIDVQHSNKHGQHWVTQDRFHKCYCKRIRSSEMSKVARKVIKRIDLDDPAQPIYGLSEGDDFA